MNLNNINITHNISKVNMFLTKKNTGPSNKGKQKNSKALGGWDDNQDEEQQVGISSKADYNKLTENPISGFKSQTHANTNKNNNNNNANLLDDEQGAVIRDYSTGGIAMNNNQLKSSPFGFGSSYKQPGAKQQLKSIKKKQTQNYYTPEELADLPNIQLECRILEPVLEPGGIRVKPNDTLLQQFYEEVKNLDISIIGSLLISYLYNPNAQFQTKAKAIYTIEYLVKKNIQYSVYFKLHSDKIKDSPNPQQNIQNYQKIKKSLLAALGAIIMRPQERKQEQLNLIAKEGINYVDPGYNSKQQTEGLRGFMTMSKQNSDKIEKQKQRPIKKLISPTQMKKQKKALAGPNANGSKRQQNNQFDLLGQNLAITNNPQPQIFGTKVDKNVDLLGNNQESQKANEPQPNLLSFDQLVQRQRKKNIKSKQFDFTF